MAAFSHAVLHYGLVQRPLSFGGSLLHSFKMPQWSPMGEEGDMQLKRTMQAMGLCLNAKDEYKSVLPGHLTIRGEGARQLKRTMQAIRLYSNAKDGNKPLCLTHSTMRT